jgi:hypothetical protein
MIPLPYCEITDRHGLHYARLWCEELWGKSRDNYNQDGTWSVYWGGIANTYQWHFATEEQRTWFILKWKI